MIADSHIHTEFSGDSETPVTAQVEQAVRLGMKDICITDHMDMDFPEDIDFELDTDAYVKRILEVKELYKERIHIRLGVELGMQEHLRDRQQKYMDSYPFDFVIGSMHLLHGEDPYYGKIFERIGDQAAYREYFRATLDNLKAAPPIDTLGHLDYAVRYGKHKDREYSYRAFADEIDAILQFLIEHGIALEVNGAGYRVLGVPNPHPDVIRRYRELGGELLTVGSDGHIPEHLGQGLIQIEALLQECGFRYYTVFEGRKPRFLKI